MKTDRFDEQFNLALDSLKGDLGAADLVGFEHEVWSEIAIRSENSAGSPTWFSLPTSAAAACAVLAIALGSMFGLTRAQAYEKEASLEVEQRYVESIHPVMMSAEHAGHSH